MIAAYDASAKLTAESSRMAAWLQTAAGKSFTLSDALQRAADTAAILAGSGPVSGWLSGAIADAGTLYTTLINANRARLAAMQTPYTAPDGDGQIVDRGQLNANMVGRGAPVFAQDFRNDAGALTPGGVRPRQRPREIDFGLPSLDSGSSGTGAGSSAPASGSLADLTVQAKKAMDTLDLALAAINEKVKAGFMSTAEAADAVKSAKENAGNSLAELTAQLDKLGPTGKASADQLRTSMKGLAADLKTVGTDLSKTLSEGFKSPFKDLLSGATTAKGAISDLGDFIKNKFAEIAADRATTGFIEPLINMLMSGASGLFGGGAGGAVKTSPIPAARPYAVGGVPDGAPLSAYRNQVVDRPTIFAMASGAGLMAEAGKEAIMPVGDGGVLAMLGGRELRLALTRGAGGRLGVALPEWSTNIVARAPIAFARGGVVSGGKQARIGMAPGASAGGASAGGASAGGASDRSADDSVSGGRPSGGGNVVVNITTPPGHTAQVSERRGDNGKIVDVLVAAVEGRMAANMRAGRGALPAALQETYALPRATR